LFFGAFVGQILFSQSVGKALTMVSFIELECPFCGSECVVPVDAIEGNSELVSDCENCCRPFRLRVSMQDGEAVDWSVDI
jgi:hypothetical protein